MKTPTISVITQNLSKTLEGLRYGEVCAVLKVHEGRVCSVTYSRTEKEVQK